MYQVNVNEASNQLAELVEAAIRGEAVFITKDGQETVQLVPVAPARPHPQFGSARGLIVISEDFDTPLEDFNEHME